MMQRTLSSELASLEGHPARLAGWVHRIRDLGGVRFLILRDRNGLSQVVVPRDVDLGDVGCESVVRVDGSVRRESRAPGGFEVLAESVRPISLAHPPPLDVFIPPDAAENRLETLLDHRAVSLRIPDVLDVFRVEAEILRAVRVHLGSQGFTEIKTPKLVRAGAEGGAAIFEVTYYDRTAYLAQSPQFYKQIMVGSGLERVFETGHAYRAEKSETSRHITEFVSIDFEMGFIESVQDVIDVHAGLIRAVFAAVRENCAYILERRGVELPEVGEIPQVAFPEARRILAERFGKTDGVAGDLDTEGERLICRWAKAAHGSDLVYVTGYAATRRPAYTMPDPADPTLTCSFDLLHNGVEVTTGSQRIHEYRQLLDSFEARGMSPADCEGYLAAFRHGMPPHGGMGMGLERLTKQMLGLANIKEACLFPRDRYRLDP
ncbi:MAG: aspartate--tRNA(Asn) ligase [Planctomycetota bacterium]